MDNFLGEIRWFAGPTPPRGWVFCSGQKLHISEFPALHSVIGNTFGGDSHEFQLPDYRGRLCVGSLPDRDSDAPYHLGDTGGTETTTMTEESLPTHTHAYPVTSATGSTHASQSPAISPAPQQNAIWGAAKALTPDDTGEITQYAGPSAGDLVGLGGMATGSDGDDLTGITGGGEEQTNMMPYKVINAIIAVEGIYPG